MLYNSIYVWSKDSQNAPAVLEVYIVAIRRY